MEVGQILQVFGDLYQGCESGDVVVGDESLDKGVPALLSIASSTDYVFNLLQVTEFSMRKRNLRKRRTW